MTLTSTSTSAAFTHEDAYETLLRFVNNLDTFVMHRRIAGKFASTSDIDALNSLACTLWRIYRTKSDSLHRDGMNYADAMNYASAYVLSRFNDALTNVSNV